MLIVQIRKYLPIIFAAIFVSIAITSVSYKSHTRDENRHLVRGVMLLETGDYRLNKHHPLFANVLAAIPQLFNDDLKTPSIESDLWKSAAKDEIADEFVEVNGGKRPFVSNVLNKSRYFMIIVFAISGLWIINMIKNEFGDTVGNIFSFLYFFSPNLIANAQLVTTDALIVPLIFAATMYLYRFAKYRMKRDYLLFVLISFLSLLTKYSAIPVAFIWLIFLGYIAYKNTIVSKKRLLNIFAFPFITILSWFLLLFASYGFRLQTIQSTNYADTQKTINNLGDFDNTLKNFPEINNIAHKLYTDVKLPFPEYIHGFLDNVFFHNAYGHDTFLFGQYSKTGWWYYFPLSFIIKEPVPIFIGIIILTVILIKYLYTKRLHIGVLSILASIPIFYLCMSMFSSLNLGIRHILVIFSFIYLGLSYIVTRYTNNKVKILYVLLGIWYLISSITIYPNYLEYFNEFTGGANNGHMYLLDSNLSWAQNDFLVEDYIKELNTNKRVYLDPLEKIDDGIIIIDTDLLMGRDINKREKTRWLREMYLSGDIKPIDRIAYTHLVFDL